MALTDNIISYWKLDESSGNASDSVAANTLTNNGTAVYDAGLINNGIDLGTSNTTKSLSTTSNLGISGGACSYSFWVKLTTEISAGLYVFSNQSNAAANNAYNIYYDFNGGTRRLVFERERTGTANDDVFNTITLGTTTWNHVVMTYDGATVTGYVNGTSVGTVSSSGAGASTNGNHFVLGAYNPNGALVDFSSTHIDEVGVWSRALSSAEVTSLYNGGAGNQYPFSVAITRDSRNLTLLGVG